MSWLHAVAFGLSAPVCARVADHDNPTSSMTPSRTARTLFMVIPYGHRLHEQSRSVLRLLQGGILAWATGKERLCPLVYLATSQLAPEDDHPTSFLPTAWSHCALRSHRLRAQAGVPGALRSDTPTPFGAKR